MKKDRLGDQVLDAERLREIPVWARRYAQNRTAAMLVQIGIFAAGFLGFAGLPYLAMLAHRHGMTALAVLALVGLAALTVGWAWYCVVGAKRIVPVLTARLYGSEGTAIASGPAGKATGYWCPVLFGLALIAHLVLSFAGVLPIRWMQPISALYVVPFLLWLWWAQVPRTSPFLLIWPALYTIHAGLLLAGVPIRFGGPWEMLNMLVPQFGYGLVAGIAGHLYGRYALSRLRDAAALPANENGGPQS